MDDLNLSQHTKDLAEPGWFNLWKRFLPTEEEQAARDLVDDAKMQIHRLDNTQDWGNYIHEVLTDPLSKLNEFVKKFTGWVPWMNEAREDFIALIEYIIERVLNPIGFVFAGFKMYTIIERIYIRHDRKYIYWLEEHKKTSAPFIKWLTEIHTEWMPEHNQTLNHSTVTYDQLFDTMNEKFIEFKRTEDITTIQTMQTVYVDIDVRRCTPHGNFSCEYDMCKRKCAIHLTASCPECQRQELSRTQAVRNIFEAFRTSEYGCGTEKCVMPSVPTTGTLQDPSG